MKNKNFISMLLIGFALVGCAKDQTVDQYDQQQAELDAEKNQPAVGDWYGTVTDPNNAVVGTIHVQLENLSSATNTSDNSTTQTSTLGGSVELTTIPTSQVQITQASYDSNSSTIAATITAGTTSLNLSGTISGNTLTGTVRVQGESTASNFIAFRGTNSTAQNLVISSDRGKTGNLNFAQSTPKATPGLCELLNKSQAPFPPPATLGNKNGRKPTPPTAPSGLDCNVILQMTIQQVTPNPATNFLNAFSDDRTVMLNILYYFVGQTGNIGSQTEQGTPLSSVQFNSVNWDSVSGDLDSVNVSGINFNTIDCKPKTFAAGQGWNCAITQQGYPFSADFAPGNIVTQ
jgi:hypothetical protein